MRKFYDDYGWVIAIFVFALVIARAFWGRAPFCGTQEEQCLREWLSASGGWVALAVGIPSLIFLQKQIKAAIAGNENSAKILLRRNYALAKKVDSRSDFIAMNAIGLELSINAQQPGFVASPPDRSQVAFKLDLIVDLLQEGAFDKFEEEIEFPSPFNAETLRRRVHNIKVSLEPLSTITLTDEIRKDVLHFCHSAQQYAVCCKDIAKRFVAEADEMRGIPRHESDHSET